MDVDSLVAATLHSVDSSFPPSTAGLSPSASSRSSALDSLSGRQLRVDCLHRLLPVLQSAGLLSSYQRSIVQSALSSYSPRYLAVVDGWLQCERSHQLAVRAAIRSTHSSEQATSASSAVDQALPARPTSLQAPTAAPAHSVPAGSQQGGGQPAPLPLPLSSLLSSGVGSSGFSPSRVLSHLLTSALVSTLEEAWLACFMSVPTSQAKRVSRAERVRLELSGSSELVYGEVSFPSLAAILWSLPALPSTGGRFVDLGSGAGRAVVGALLLHEWEEVRGIELLDGLHRASEQVRDKVERDRKAGGLGGVAVLHHHYQQQQQQQHPHLTEQEDCSGQPAAQQRGRLPRLSLTKANFFDVDWSDADVSTHARTSATQPHPASDDRLRLTPLPLPPLSLLLRWCSPTQCASVTTL